MLAHWIENPDPNVYMSDNYLVLDFENTIVEKDGSPLNPEVGLLLARWWYAGEHKGISGNQYDMDALVADIKKADFIVAQNAKHELQWLYRIGVPLETVLVYDTMIGEYVLHGNLPVRLDLGTIASRYGMPGKEHYVDMCMKAGICPSELPASMLNSRCLYDVNVTRAIFLQQREILLSTDRLRTQFSRCILTPVLADIEFNGMFLDKERVLEQLNHYNSVMYNIGQVFEQNYAGINLNSPKQLGELLYDTLGFEELKDREGNPIRTGSGGRKADADTLSALKATTKEQKEFAKLWADYNQANAYLTKNLQFFHGIVEEKGGIMQAVFNQTRTVTHRLSSSGRRTQFSLYDKPKGAQFQNLPRIFKNLFAARNDGWKFAEIDGCFTAGHRMLMADGSWKLVEDVTKGDQVIAFEEEREGVHRKLRRATVQATKQRVVPCYKVTFEDGQEVTVSNNHKFLGSDSHSAAHQWLTAEELYTTRRKCYVSEFCKPWEYQNDELLWGTLGGMIDCDGSVSHDKFQITQSVANPVAARIEEVLEQLGFEKRQYHFRRSELSTADVCSYNITGLPNLLKVANLSGSVKAAKIMTASWEGKSMNRNKRKQVVSVVPAGVQTVYSIQNTEGTYIVEGLCNHNCQLEFRMAAQLAYDKQAFEDIKDGFDVHRFSASVLNNVTEEQVTKGQRQDAKADTFKPLFGGQSGTKAQVKYYEAFKERYWQVADWQEDNKWTVLKDKELRLPSGLIFYWPDTTISKSGYISNSTNICNYPVQATATADIIPIGLTCAWHKMKEAKMESFIVNTVHDSILAELAPGEEQQFGEIAAYSMTTYAYNFLEKVHNYKFFVPLAAGLTIGDHWTEGEEIVHDSVPPYTYEEVA